MVYSVITQGYIHGEDTVSAVVKTKIGGIFVDETITDKEKWVITPDANNNVWSYSMDNNNWIIDELNTEFGHNKGALYATRYHPTSVKVNTTACANCTTFSGTYTLSNQEDKG